MLDLSTVAANSVFTLVDNIDDTTTNPTVTLTWDADNQGGELIIDDTPANDVVISEMMVTASATSAKAGDSETFYLTGGTLVAGKTRQIQFTATQRGVPDSETSVPPTTSLTRLFREHKRNSSIWTVSEVLLVKNLKSTFTSSTITETVTAGEPLTSTTENLGVSEHLSKYYLYSNLDLSITSIANDGSGNARITSAAHGLVDEQYINITGTTDYNGVHEISEVLISGTVDAVADYSGTVAGTIKITDTAHGLDTGAVVTIAGTTSYNNTYTITKIDDDNFYVTESFVADETGSWTTPDLDKFDIAVTYTSSQSGDIEGFTNYQGVLLAGQTIVKDATFTLYNMKAIVTGFTGLGESWVYIDNGGSFVTTSTATSTVAGVGRTSGTELFGVERVPPGNELTDAQVVDTSSAVSGMVSGQQLGLISSDVIAEETALTDFVAGDTYVCLPLGQALGQTTAGGQYLGYDSATEMLRFPIIGSGVSTSSIDLSIAKVGTPSDSVRVRIETDDGAFNNSGTLFDANATADVVWSTLPTWGTLTPTTWTFGGSFTLEEDKLYWVVMSRTGATATSNYYYSVKDYGSYAQDFSLLEIYDGASWDYSATANNIYQRYFSTTGAKRGASAYDYQVITKANEQRPFAMFYGIAENTGSAGDTVKIRMNGVSDKLSGLSKHNGVLFSDIRGELVPKTDAPNPGIGVALSSTELLIKKTSPTATFEF